MKIKEFLKTTLSDYPISVLCWNNDFNTEWIDISRCKNKFKDKVIGRVWINDENIRIIPKTVQYFMEDE